MNKHKKVAETLWDMKLAHFNVSEEIKWKKLTSTILAKHYDPAPELTKGDWVKSDLAINKEPRLYLEDRCMFVDGDSSAVLNKKSCYTPHIFTESDLKLLDTDEVKYELYKIPVATTGDCFHYGVRVYSCGRLTEYSSFQSIDLAIQEAFNQRVYKESFFKTHKLQRELGM